jgi:hypothetical protein
MLPRMLPRFRRLLATSNLEGVGAEPIARAIFQPQAARALAAVEDDGAHPPTPEGTKAGRVPVSGATRDAELALGVVIG